jgi:DDE superfamily endonuclease/Helix-turn-helix of DDE superfamily endonuclease
MLCFDVLAAKPAAFVSFTGLTPAQFRALADDFAPHYQRHRAAAATTRRGRAPRRRAPGGGHPYAHDLPGRLLLALVWLKVYPTYEVLGLLFGLDKGNARRNVLDVLEALDTFEDFPFDRPDPDRRKRGSVAEVLADFPQVRLVIDSKEQRVQRPGGPHERQKPYYSGKKRAHTLKTQLAVSPSGLIESVSPSVVGSVNDVRLLRETGLLGRLGEGEAAMTDKGYEGADKGERAGVLVLPKKDRKKNPCTEADQARNRLIARYRIVVEHVIAQLNRFTVLRQVWRGKRVQRHSQVVRVVAVLANRRTRVQPLKRYGTAA